MWRRGARDVVGDMVERGQMPFDVARDVVAGLAYEQPRRLFFER
jgi:hypothetical protein